MSPNTLQAKSAESRPGQAINHAITVAPCLGSHYVNIFESGKRAFSLDSRAIRFVLDNADAIADAMDIIEDDITESAERGKAIDHLLKQAGYDKRANPEAFRKAKQQLMGKAKPEAAVNPEYVKEYGGMIKGLKLN